MDLLRLLAETAQAAGPEAGPRARARILAAVLALIVVLLLLIMALVGMSAVRRRLRADGSRRQRRRTRAVDAWAEAGRRAELAEPPADDEADGSDEEGKQ